MGRAKAANPAGGLARDGGDASLRRADRDFRAARLRLFRSYLRFYVTRAAPLLVDMAAHFDVDLRTALLALRPRSDWPFGERSRKGEWRPRYADHWLLRGPGRWPAPFRARSLPRRKDVEGAPEIHLLLHGDTLDVRVRMDGVLLCTREDKLMVWLPGRLPDTVANCASGRKLTDVVDHPALRGRDYVIKMAVQAGDRSLLVAGASALCFAMPDLNAQV